MSVTVAELSKVDRSKRLNTTAKRKGRASTWIGASDPASFLNFVVAAAAITAALLFYIYFRVESLRLGYILTQHQQTQLRLVLENRALKTEIGTLTSPARLRRLAEEKLGMVPAKHIVDLTASQRGARR